MAWATRHNCITLQRMFSQAAAWWNERLDTGTEITRVKAEAMALETEAEVWQSKEIALSALSEVAQTAFKEVIEKLKWLFESFTK